MREFFGNVCVNAVFCWYSAFGVGFWAFKICQAFKLSRYRMYLGQGLSGGAGTDMDWVARGHILATTVVLIEELFPN